MMFMNSKINTLYNMEIMRSDPELQKKMEEYGRGFQQNKETDAFNRFIPVPTDETTKDTQ